MKKYTFVALLALCAAGLVSFTPVAAQEGLHKIHHFFMRGNVLEKNGAEVYLCIGSKDNARVGQVLEIIRVESTPPIKGNTPNFKRIKIGTVKLTQIVDEHFAKATIQSGNVQVGQIAELKVDVD
ncbi:MAG: hypothetical protein JNM27_06940 [Leptospirales bacterium]|nr:hypothetical protein [Leptospirales bacterium]